MEKSFNDNEKPTKPCFGDLKKVFPVGREGLREVPFTCQDCPDKVPCLRAALDSADGLGVRQEALRRAPAGGLVDRIKRWSEMKALNRRVTRNKD